MTDHDSAHQLCGDAKEVGAILPLWRGIAGELEVSVVEQRGGLQRVVRSLPVHVMPRQALELRLHERNQLLQCTRVSIAPVGEELRDLLLLSRFRTAHWGPD